MASKTKIMAAIELGAEGVLQIVIAGVDLRELAAAKDRLISARSADALNT